MSVLKLTDIKQRNQSAVLRLFCEHDGLSRREIAALTECDHATVTRAVKSLLDSRMLIPDGKCEISHGRPREMLRLHPDAPVGIGIELHPQAVSGVVIDLRGNVTGNIHVSWQDGIKNFQNALLRCINDLQQLAGKNIFGWAFAAIGTLSAGGAVIRDCANCPALNGFDLQKFWEDNFTMPLPVFTDRMLAEMHWFLSHEPELRRNVTLLVHAGSGIGMAMAHNGQIINMNRRHGGELGHNTVVPDGRLCRCGRQGCLEAYASAAVLMERGKCRTLTGLLNTPDGKQAAGQAAVMLAHALANLSNNLLPDRLLITGSLLTLGESFISEFENTFRKYLLDAAAGKLQLTFRPGIADAAAGAALLVRENFLQTLCYR